MARYYPYFLLFLAAMYGLLSTTDMMWFFFIFWQMMTLPGYALIRFEHRKAEQHSRRQQVPHDDANCLRRNHDRRGDSGSHGRGRAGRREPEVRLRHREREPAGAVERETAVPPALAFALFLVGFGIKMGMWPFGQIWLPDAHPAAPSPVSAMLSGVMIKTGVYGLMRYFLWLVPAGAAADFPAGAMGFG